ncbi:MAG: hypothetical protein GEV13_18905 [Rhodospirillales bacterium]|nr:hypothetical protein [Rhodospirillales bacterium]
MSAPDDTLTVEHRIARIRAILMALPCIADKGGDGFDVGATCEHLEMMAQEEMGKVVAALGKEVLDKDC